MVTVCDSTDFVHYYDFLLAIQIKLGTVDQDEAQTEWVIRPYMNTTKKRKFLGE